jgi:hypothetical protein
MPALTRRRDPEVSHETWRIYYGDVVVGLIARSVGNPNAAPQWQWRCGFYPGSRPGECTSGTAPTFDQARADFEAAWRGYHPDQSWEGPHDDGGAGAPCNGYIYIRQAAALHPRGLSLLVSRAEKKKPRRDAGAFRTFKSGEISTSQRPGQRDPRS